MITMQELEEDGIKVKPHMFRINYAAFKLETQEFTDGEFIKMDYKEYLHRWAEKLNQGLENPRYIVVNVRSGHSMDQIGLFRIVNPSKKEEA